MPAHDAEPAQFGFPTRFSLLVIQPRINHHPAHIQLSLCFFSKAGSCKRMPQAMPGHSIDTHPIADSDLNRALDAIEITVLEQEKCIV